MGSISREQRTAKLGVNVFTKRQWEVLKGLIVGKGNKQLARDLHISIETVKEHVHEMLVDTGMGNRTELVGWYLREEMRLFLVGESSTERLQSVIDGKPEYPTPPLPAPTVRLERSLAERALQALREREGGEVRA